MRTGQHVRVRPGSFVARHHALPPDADGVVKCQYKLLRRGPSVTEKVDVQFSENRMIWGVPVKALVVVEEREAKN